jgi:gamma-glutamyl:cysteine ligase YbdK (ATP-grasp superfamily)
MDSLRSELSSFHRRTEVVDEVAPNSLEVKICLTQVGSLFSDFRALYRRLAQVIEHQDVLIAGGSQPFSSGLTEGATHFLTVDVFKAALTPLAATNSIHLHFGARDEAEAIALYSAGNRIAPILLAASQCSVIDSKERGRAHLLRDFIGSLPTELAVPWPITSIADYESRLAGVRANVAEVVAAFSPAYRRLLNERYPHFVDDQGGVIGWSPDKVFHFMRLRPDKVLPELGLVGSVEFRPLDGQPTLERDLAVLQLTLGLMAFEMQHNAMPLSQTEAVSLTESVRNVAGYGFGAIMWNGLADTAGARNQALVALGQLGLESDALARFVMDGGQTEYLPSLLGELLLRNHERFLQSAVSA